MYLPSPRILVIGPIGAGKTTLSIRIATQLSIPCHHLDLYFYGQNQKSKPLNDWQQFNSDICASSTSWVIDGNYFDAFPQRIIYATEVVYLDIPWATCCTRAIIRTVKSRHKARTDVGITDVLSIKFFTNILFYKQRRRTAFIDATSMAKSYSVPLHYIRSAEDTEQLVIHLREKYPTSCTTLSE